MQRGAGWAGLFLAGHLVACGREAEPRWIDVAAAAEHVTSSIEDGEQTLPDGRTVRLAAEGDGVRLEVTFRPRDWVEVEAAPGFWIAQQSLPVPKADRTNSASLHLTAGERSFTQLPYRKSDDLDRHNRFPPMSFRITKDGLLMRLAKGEKPAEETVLSHLIRGEGSRGMVLGSRFSGRGFLVWPGQTLRVTLDVPEGAVLRFATALDPLEEAASAGSKPVVFRVLQDGEQVFEHVVQDPAEPSHAWHSIRLPRSGRKSELVFGVRGEFANTSFLDPVLRPGEIGAPGQRPWEERRPDILVFLADTFRADNMSAYGGKLELTPNLDRLARESLLFRRARSVGTFTLPTHTTIFSGVMPMQAGVEGVSNAASDELVTIAELLASAGYRTGAVTDAGFVSQRFGLAQGFAYFHEDRSDIRAAFAAERALSFLDADDGRPVFLFVHTYQTHKPYAVSDETRRLLGERLGIQRPFQEIEDRLRALVGQGNRIPADPAQAEEARALALETQPHYWGVVADLDREFGAFVEALEGRRWFENGWLVFTSDHGEAFGEHGEIDHGFTVYEEKLRIPLLIAGHGITPRAVDHPASQLDLAPTVADMAGVPRRPEWRGESLLSLARDRAVFSFGLDPEGTISVVEGSRKVIGYEVDRAVDGKRILGAFDLALDPGEKVRVPEDRESWPRDMLRRHGSELERFFQPIVEARSAQLDQKDLDELNRLGYVDGFDE
jgi:arylsulfatase A-like enzyme